MSFGKETYSLLSNPNNEVVKSLYEKYAKKLLAYTQYHTVLSLH